MNKDYIRNYIIEKQRKGCEKSINIKELRNRRKFPIELLDLINNERNKQNAENYKKHNVKEFYV